MQRCVDRQIFLDRRLQHTRQQSRSGLLNIQNRTAKVRAKVVLKRRLQIQFVLTIGNDTVYQNLAIFTEVGHTSGPLRGVYTSNFFPRLPISLGPDFVLLSSKNFRTKFNTTIISKSINKCYKKNPASIIVVREYSSTLSIHSAVRDESSQLTQNMFKKTPAMKDRTPKLSINPWPPPLKLLNCATVAFYLCLQSIANACMHRVD